MMNSIICDKQCKRLDVFLTNSLDMTRSHAQKLIANGLVAVNDVVVSKVSSGINVGDKVFVSVQPCQELDIVAEDIDIDIVYQDSDLAVINKAQGMTVHPASGVYSGTLVNAIMYHIKDLSGINGVTRPGIVHRLDKNTSGLLVVAKNDKAHNHLASQIQDKTCSRIYWAIVEGVVKTEQGIIDKAIARSRTDRKKMAIDDNGRHAVTNYKVIQRFRNNTLVQFQLNTGRTHQIRVHSKYLGHPVVGDKEYGYKNQRYALQGQLLHAKELSFVHPTTQQRMTFTAPLPRDYDRILQLLQKERL